MNLRAVVRKARNGKLGGAGGYLAHVGVGIMLAGHRRLRRLRALAARHARRSTRRPKSGTRR